MKKICTNCGFEKDISEFYIQKKGKYGVTSLCKVCNSQRTCMWQRKNKDFVNIRRKKWRMNNPKKRMIEGSKMRAKKDNIEFSITENDFEVPKYCPYFGIELIVGQKKQNYNSPTLDRIDNTKGYVPGNVEVISWKANAIKNCGTIEEHQIIVDRMKQLLGK